MKTIRDLLTGLQPLTRPSSISALDAAKAMHEAHVGALLVTDERGRPCGIFTERDLMVRVVVAGKDPARTKVGEAMTREIFSTTPDRPIPEVARELQSRHVRHLPVIENEKVVGLLSLRDLLRETLNVQRREMEALEAYIQSDGEPRATSY